MANTIQIERRKRGFFGWIFLILFWLFNAVMLVSCVSGLSSVSTTYSGLSNGAERAGAAIGTTIGMTMILGVWAAGAVILGLLVLFSRGPKFIETVSPTATPASSGALPLADVTSPSNEATQHPKRGIPIWGWVLGTLAVLIFISSLVRSPTSSSADSSAAPATDTASAAAAWEKSNSASAPIDSKPASKWSYDSDIDQMRGATDLFARVSSNNTVNFGFPYNEANMSITLRKSAKYGNDIYVGIHDGQFTCSSFDGCSIKVKFDDGGIQTFSMSTAEGGTSDVIFVQNQARFLAALRKAKTVMIEASFYNQGAQQFSFDVAGLDWKS